MSNEKGIYFPSTGERTNEALTAALEKERIKARSWRQQFDEQISRRARGGTTPHTGPENRVTMKPSVCRILWAQMHSASRMRSR